MYVFQMLNLERNIGQVLYYNIIKPDHRSIKYQRNNTILTRLFNIIMFITYSKFRCDVIIFLRHFFNQNICLLKILCNQYISIFIHCNFKFNFIHLRRFIKTIEKYEIKTVSPSILSLGIPL